MPHWRKLSDEQVAAIRARRAAGEGVRDLARYYGCSPANVCRIANGDSRGPTMRQQIAALRAQVLSAGLVPVNDRQRVRQ